MSNPPQIVTTKQLAELMQVRPNTVRNWVKDGSIPAVRTLPQGHLRFDVHEVLDALKTSNKQHAADDE